MLQIDTIDLHFQGVEHAIASYIVHSSAGPIMIETGPGSTLVHAQTGLQSLGLSVTDIKHVLVTHIHFDHAGAAGWWAQQGAHIYVHHIGAPHMIDPSRLMRSARRIYGDEMDTLWGEMVPIAEENLTRLTDNQQIVIGDAIIDVIDTPGHANHHMTFVIDGIAFAGDTAGASIPGWDLIELPAPPPEFHLEKWTASLQKLARLKLKQIYQTHFGPVPNPAQRLIDMQTVLDEATEIIRAPYDQGKSRSEIIDIYLEWRREKGREAGLSERAIHQYLTATPPIMSVDGIMRYWRKRREAEADQVA